MDFDAIIFHARDLDLQDLPKSRNPRQNYIMFIEESPVMDSYPAMEVLGFESPPYKKLANFFNWTMSYRRDSDFVIPYGWIAPKNWSSEKHVPIQKLSWSIYYNDITLGCKIKLLIQLQGIPHVSARCKLSIPRNVSTLTKNILG